MASSKSWAALVIGVLAVVLRVDMSNTLTVNGQVTSCSYTDLAGIGLGGLAALVALGAGWEVATGLTRYQPVVRKGVTLAVVALALFLGTVGLLKGFAVIMSPCG